MLEFVAKVGHPQALYNYAMTLIIPNDNLGFSILEFMFKQHQPNKEVVINCRSVFRKMMTGQGLDLIP